MIEKVAATVKGANAEESRNRIMTQAIPNFCQLDKRIDEPLNEILQRALSRDVDMRYSTCDEFLYKLEHYIYHTGYGPTNETLGKYIRELFGQIVPLASKKEDGRGGTQVLEHTARARSKG